VARSPKIFEHCKSPRKERIKEKDIHFQNPELKPENPCVGK
jgi:hypothetical protein